MRTRSTRCWWFRRGRHGGRASFATLAVILGFFLSGPLIAHDTWILPSRPRVSPGREVTFDLTSGMAFPTNEVSVKSDRLARASVRLGGTVSELAPEAGTNTALRLTARFSKPGIAAAWIESKPRTIELKPNEVREYLEEIGAWESLAGKWETEGTGKWRESYTKHAKTYMRVGSLKSHDDTWSKPVGMELELVPERDPTRLAGEELAVRLLKAGQPVPDAAVGLVAANAKSGMLSKTDSGGRVRLRFDRGGWWLIRATLLERSTKPGLDWESRFTTLTVFVGTK